MSIDISDAPPGTKVARFQQWFADALLAGGVLVVGYRASIFLLGPVYSFEFRALHLVALAFLGMLCVLAVTAPGKWGRPLALTVLATVGTVLMLFNLGGVIQQVTHAPLVTMPFIADSFCAGRFDLRCAARYPTAALALAAIFVGAMVAVQLSYPGLRRRGAQALRIVGRGLPRVAWLTPRRVLLALCGGYVLWQSIAWQDMIDREPLQQFFFAPFEIGPAELLTHPRSSYRAAAIAPARPRPLMIITVDALRADRVGLDPDRPTLTPFLRSLAQRGSLHSFDPAFATCTYSFCGITAAVTSSSWAGQQAAPPIAITDALAGAGYRSHLLLSGLHRDTVNLATLYGRNIGVMRDDSDRETSRKSDDYALIDELRRLEMRDDPRNFFFIHLMSPHIAGKKRGLANAADAGTWDFVNQHFQASAYTKTYDAGVAQADDVIRLIFAELARRGLLDTIVVAITADHGERLDPRGALGHGGTPDAAISRIPLLIYDAQRPRYAGAAIASHIDAAPTLLAAAGVPAPPSWDGVALQQRSARVAVPIDSRLRHGAAFRAGERTYLYTCAYRSGEEQLQTAAGDEVTGADRERTLALARRMAAGLRQRRDAARCSAKAR